MCVRIKASDKMLGIILATNGLAMANSEPTVPSAVLVLSYHRVVEMFQYWGGRAATLLETIQITRTVRLLMV